MKKKRTFAYLGTHEIGKTTVAAEAIKCGLSNVVESLLTCPKCKDYYGHDINHKCFNCGTKIHSQ